MNISPWIPCTNCNAPIIVENTFIYNYFNNKPILCTNCGFSLNWFKAVNQAIRKNFMLNQAFSVLEANTKIIEIYLKQGTRTCINFLDNGIPKESRILYINYTPQGGNLYPLEIHGNVPHRRILTEEIWLYPASSSNNQTTSETKVNVMISWIENSEDEIEFINIVDAFEAYSNNQYLDSVVPANVAVESALAKLLNTFISNYVSNKHTDNFLKDAATYSYQLNVVLPLIVKLKNLPVLPDNIRGNLNNLRDYRNQIAHTGKTKDVLTKENIADALCAALFGLKYISYIHDKLF